MENKRQDIKQNLNKYALFTFLAIIIPLFYAQHIGFIGFNYDKCIRPKLFYVNRLQRHHFKQNEYFAIRWYGDKFVPKETMVKRVGCVPGQKLTVNVQTRMFFCNGKLIAIAKTHSSKGIPVGMFVYNGIIPKGDYFAVGSNPWSYDSRYWGFVQTKRIIGRAYPLIW